MSTTVLLAGATGMLGDRIAHHLLDQPQVELRLLLRAAPPPDTGKARALQALTARGARVVPGDVTDPASLDAAVARVDVVISALQGGPAIIEDGQIALAQAAAGAGARRFIPSDFAIDLFAAPEGAPQFAMRRRADHAITALPLEVAHVLNGAFMDLLLDPESPALVDLAAGAANVWGSGEERFNLTTVDDTARFTAALATDPADVAGVHCLSGAETSINTIIDETERLTGTILTRRDMGSLADLRRMTAAADDPWSVVPQWYLLAMFTLGPFPTTDNQRYPHAAPTGLCDYLTTIHHSDHPADQAAPHPT